MIPIAIKLFFTGLWKRLQALFALALRYPREAAIIALLCLSLWLWQGNGKRDRIIKQRDAQIAAFITAQKQAKAAQDAQDKANVEGQLAANRELEKAHAQLEIARRDAVADYVSSHRLPAKGSAPRCPGVADLPDRAGPPASGQADSDYIAIPARDAEAFSETELQNAERGRFLRGLLSQGLAVPESLVK